jgi:hypothetical protein
MAHIVAATPKGPRGQGDLTLTQRALFDNLLLLCSACHAVIDKAPEVFPVEELKKWKEDHEDRIRQLFNVSRYATRADARRALAPSLTKNKVIFDLYGPASPAAQEYDSEAVHSWQRKMLEVILPTSRRMITLLEANTHLMKPSEVITLEEFRQHVDDMEARHVHHQPEPNSQRFPQGMNGIFED